MGEKMLGFVSISFFVVSSSMSFTSSIMLKFSCMCVNLFDPWSWSHPCGSLFNQKVQFTCMCGNIIHGQYSLCWPQFGCSLFNKKTISSYIEKRLIYIVVMVHLDGQLDDIQHLIHLLYFISILSLSFMRVNLIHFTTLVSFFLFFIPPIPLLSFSPSFTLFSLSQSCTQSPNPCPS